MPVGDTAGQIYADLVFTEWPGLGPDRTATTFDLWRRTTAGAVNDLGVPNDPFTKIQSNQPCTIVGFKRDKEGAFEIKPQGKVEYIIEEMHTTLLDVRAGDNVFIYLDSRYYNVERASLMGTVTKLVLDHASEQL
jgi:hypothetical protein